MQGGRVAQHRAHSVSVGELYLFCSTWLAGQTHQAQGTRGTAVGYSCDPEGAQPSSQTLPTALQALLCGLELLPFLQ